jgi:hypothetical protein
VGGAGCSIGGVGQSVGGTGKAGGAADVGSAACVITRMGDDGIIGGEAGDGG